MKRKLLSIILLATMLCVSACGGQTTDGDVNTEADVQKENDTSIIGEADTNVELPDNTEEVFAIGDPAYSKEITIPEDMLSMLAPMDAILMCGAETGFEYDAKDPEVFWRLMYYNLGNHGSRHQLAKLNEGTLYLDRRAVQEFATGMFVDYSDLPAVPEDFAESITYDASMDQYQFSLGDRGLSDAEFVKCMQNADGSYDVTARLYDLEDNSTIVSAVFHLVTNPYADGISEPLFLYTIASFEEITE